MSPTTEQSQKEPRANKQRAPERNPSYVEAFDGIYPDLAKEYGLPLYPFFLALTAGNPDLSLQDGLHPNAQGIEKIVADILPQIEEFLAKLP